LTWGTDLEHYLDTLEPRPGALAGSKPLELSRRVGRHLTSYAHVWQPLIQRQPRQPETRVHDRVAPTRPASAALRVSAWAIETALGWRAPMLRPCASAGRRDAHASATAAPDAWRSARRARTSDRCPGVGADDHLLAVRWTWAMSARSELNPITSSNRTACSSTSRPLAPSVDGEPGQALPLTLRWLGPSSGNVSTAEPPSPASSA